MYAFVILRTILNRHVTVISYFLLWERENRMGTVNKPARNQRNRPSDSGPMWPRSHSIRGCYRSEPTWMNWCRRDTNIPQKRLGLPQQHQKYLLRKNLETRKSVLWRGSFDHIGHPLTRLWPLCSTVLKHYTGSCWPWTATVSPCTYNTLPLNNFWFILFPFLKSPN